MGLGGFGQEDYDGRCGATAVVDLDEATKKEKFSWKCHAEWPCRQSCKLDLEQCPEAKLAWPCYFNARALRVRTEAAKQVVCASAV